MKILQILPELHVGGVERGTVDLAAYLVRQGHDAVVVSNGGEMAEDLQKAGIPHYTLPVHRKCLWTMLRSVRELRKILVHEKVDIVHARSRVPAWIAFFACRGTDAAFLTTCHGYYSTHFLSRVMGWPKIIIVPSEVIGRHMIEDFGVSPENIRRIPRSVDPQKFTPSRPKDKTKSESIIAIIGRITPLKGHAYFLHAMARVIRSIPYARIWIIGDAPAKKPGYKEQLQVLVRRLGLTDYVEFLGNRRDIPQLLSLIDLMVLSTVTEEAFGRVILEAQAAGVPVVATKVGGVVEIIDDEKTGLLVMPRDSDTMAKAVIRILKDQNLRQRLTEEARKKIESHFTLQHMASQTITVYEQLLKSMRILVIKLSALGDVVLITASLKALREAFPRASIHCLIGKESRQILQRCPYIDGLIIYDAHHKDRGPWGLLRLARKLRAHKFDKVIDFQNNRKSHLLSLFSLPRESYGYDNGKWGFVLSNRIKDDKKKMPAVEHQFRILKMLGIEYRPDVALELWLSPQDDADAVSLLESEWLGNSKNIVGIHISASEKWKTKNWPVPYIAQLCDMLSGKNIRVILTGARGDMAAAKEVLTLAKSKPANLVGKTDIMQLAALIRRCRVFVSPDSCPLHIAAAVKTPFVALFGPTDAGRHLPPATRLSVMSKELACAPCYSPSCEIGKHSCMKDITPQEVERAILALIETP